jgi:hypothetical protein
MKTVMSVFLALALSAAVIAHSSSQSTPSGQSQSGSQNQGSANQNQNSSGQSNSDQNQATSTQSSSSSSGTKMAGKVSSDGKSFTNDSDSKTYRVDNPDALSGHEGQHVAIIVRADPDTGTIHITQLQLPQ